MIKTRKQAIKARKYQLLLAIYKLNEVYNVKLGIMQEKMHLKQKIWGNLVPMQYLQAKAPDMRPLSRNYLNFYLLQTHFLRLEVNMVIQFADQQFIIRKVVNADQRNLTAMLELVKNRYEIYAETE